MGLTDPSAAAVHFDSFEKHSRSFSSLNDNEEARLGCWSWQPWFLCPMSEQ